MTKQEFRYRKRNFLHFDTPVELNQAWKIATNPKKVANHSFYPLLGYSVRTMRYLKKNGIKIQEEKVRDIKICSHIDTAIYSYYGQILSQNYERQLEKFELQKSITAFRSVKNAGSNIDHAAEVFDYIENNRPCVALVFDIKKFFDRLDHQLLKSVWAENLEEARLPADHFAIYKSLTNFCWVDKNTVYKELGISKHNERYMITGGVRRRLCTPLEFRQKIRGAGVLKYNPELSVSRGIPQGSPMSAVLSNMYLLGFDHSLNSLANQVGGLYRRYCDDIIFIVPEGLKEQIMQAVSGEALRVKMDLHPDKTHAVSFPVGKGNIADGVLQYLGFTFDGSKILLRLSSIDRYYSKMRAGVSLARQTQRKANRKEESRKLPFSKLRRKQLYIRYSYLYSRHRPADPSRASKTKGNFLTYVYRAAAKLKSPHIKAQMRAHWRKLNEEISKPIKHQLCCD
jgi:RNA-directed DNA polymerase